MSEFTSLTAIELERANAALKKTLERCRDDKFGLTDMEKFHLRQEAAKAVIQAAKVDLRSLREESKEQRDR